MSIIRADSIKNRVGDGAPDFPNGITVTGVVTATSLQTNVTSLNVTGGHVNVGTNIQLGDAGIITATSYRGDGGQLTGIDATSIQTGNTSVQTTDTGSDGQIKFTTEGTLRATFSNGGHFLPNANNTYNLGSTSLRLATIYTNDLELSNKGSQNSVDGTWGDWTLQEGETDIFMLNNRTGKKFKINMTEVD